MSVFQKGDTVYIKDGTQYYFDHAAGEFGMVSPFILTQTLTYDQQDFEENQEVADHMIPIRLDHLSKEPWARVVHQETADAVAEKKATLAGLDEDIGAARRELRQAQERLDRRGKELETEARVLERRFQWVKDFRRLIGEEELFMIAVNEDETEMPYRISAPTEVRLKKTQGTATWNYNYLGMHEDDGDHIRMFKTEAEMAHFVRSVYAKKDRDVDEQIKWFDHWNDVVVISAEAKEKLKENKLAKIDQQYERAEQRRDAAESDLTNIANRRLSVEQEFA